MLYITDTSQFSQLLDMAAASETVLDDERLFEQLERYPWNEDVEFQVR